MAHGKPERAKSAVIEAPPSADEMKGVLAAHGIKYDPGAEFVERAMHAGLVPAEGIAALSIEWFVGLLYREYKACPDWVVRRQLLQSIGESKGWLAQPGKGGNHLNVLIDESGAGPLRPRGVVDAQPKHP